MVFAQIEATRDILVSLLESDGGRLVLLVAILSLFISMASLYVLNRQTSATSKATEALNAKVERDAEQTASIAQLMLGIHDIARSIKSQTEQNERALKIAVATQEEERETRAAVASLTEDIDLQLNALREHITATGDGNTRRLLQRMDDLFSRFDSAEALAKQHFMKSLDESTRLLGEVERAKLAILQEIGHIVTLRSEALAPAPLVQASIAASRTIVPAGIPSTALISPVGEKGMKHDTGETSGSLRAADGHADRNGGRGHSPGSDRDRTDGQ